MSEQQTPTCSVCGASAKLKIDGAVWVCPNGHGVVAVYHYQDTFAGCDERELMLLSDLLTQLGVANEPLVEQRAAVRAWLAEGNVAGRMLALGLSSRGLVDEAEERKTLREEDAE